METIKTAVITGGGRGLGAALARELGRRGVEMVLVARDGAALEGVVGAVRAAGGVAHALAMDVADPEAAAQIAVFAGARLGTVDLLVNNASTLLGERSSLLPLAETSPADFRRVLEVNLLAPFALTRAIVGGMVLRGRGIVVNVSSDAAVEAYPRWGAYGASKAALDQLTRVWAAELAGSGVRFLAVDPGEMDTRMHAEAIPDADRSTLAAPEWVAALLVQLLATPSADVRVSVPALVLA